MRKKIVQTYTFINGLINSKRQFESWSAVTRWHSVATLTFWLQRLLYVKTD